MFKWQFNSHINNKKYAGEYYFKQKRTATVILSQVKNTFV